ncbi:hypothetical protein NL676_036947 [Syzygium grande]|nr:hypothetical protein NL676_036947 [Syzygium grande]
MFSGFSLPFALETFALSSSPSSPSSLSVPPQESPAQGFLSILCNSAFDAFHEGIQRLSSIRKIEMIRRGSLGRLLLLPAILSCVPPAAASAAASSASAACDLSFADRDRLYNYSLASPIPKFPHGVLSEDGFYKVAADDTVLWFQLCGAMIFNHDPPRCVDCSDCGGPSRCGMECSALVTDDVEGYPVCITIGDATSTHVDITDQKKPHSGVTVKMMSNGGKSNCSLSVSIICDPSRVQGPNLLEKYGTCDYATSLRHPSGCAKIIYVHGRGWGWFGILLIISMCHVSLWRAIPNLEFWASLPHRTKGLVMSLVQKFRGPSQGHQGSYTSVGF